MSSSDRIAQFQRMAEADPSNEMAHFSLGNALLGEKRFAEASRSLERCIELVPEMSRAYELVGRAMIGAGWADRAVVLLERGYRIAAERGDLQPRDAIAALLREIGREPPVIETRASRPAAASGSNGFTCRRTGRPGTRLERPPFKGALGAWIQENISSETWNQWIGQGTKVINELRLDFSREKDQQVYDQHMYEYLGIDEALLKQLSASS
ncbi:MAG: Fe(2+)-trafficking protein [Phycisphaeraceae bacterium]|nr:Fe(2+)-trafficking protein [Phycisphaeraceae bacterium]